MCCLPKDLFLFFGDFQSPTSYQNKLMKDMRFRVLLDRDILLEPGVEWDYLSAGGIQILIPGRGIAEGTKVVAQFY